MNDERIPTADGVRIYRTTKAPWLDAQGRVTGLIGSAHDVTERAAAEAAAQARREAEDRLALVAASVPGAVCAFEQLPDGTARLPLATAAVEDVYGFPAADLAEDMAQVLARIHQADVPDAGGEHRRVGPGPHPLAPHLPLRPPEEGDALARGLVHPAPARRAAG